jgi:hypothetical protein
MTPKPVPYVVLLVVLLTFLGLRLYNSPHTAVATKAQSVILKLKLASGPKGNEVN